jgi:hypothetical protein
MPIYANWYSDKLNIYWNNVFNRVFTVLKLGVVGLDI